MPYRLFDWHERVKEVEGEYAAAKTAVESVRRRIVMTPDDAPDPMVRRNLRRADDNLEGTYVVRIFAVFEAALRSYRRSVRGAAAQGESAAVAIDAAAGRRGQGIPHSLRSGAHAVRRVRNRWAHDDDASHVGMTIAEARARLNAFLARLPDEWD